MANENGLENVKVGDRVGPVRVGIRKEHGSWTGVLHTVTGVTPKRFTIGTGVYEKATGRKVGYRGGQYSYILATPEMLAAYQAKQEANKKKQDDLDAFHNHPAYEAASAIGWLLSDMYPGKHPLDKLTAEEWNELRNRLGA
jgi:hypothetical protein